MSKDELFGETHSTNRVEYVRNVELLPDADREIARLKQRIRELEMQTPAYNIVHMHPNEMNRLMKSMTKSINEAVKATLIEHIKKKEVGENAEPGTDTFYKILRASNSVNNPNASRRRAHMVATFLNYHEEEIRKRVCDLLLDLRQTFNHQSSVSSIFLDKRLNPPVRSGGRPKTTFNGLAKKDFDEIGKEVCFIYEGQLHQVTIWRKPSNSEYNNTDIRETRMTRARSRAIWKKGFLYPISIIEEADISSKNSMNALEHEALLLDRTKTVRDYNAPPTERKPKKREITHPPFPTTSRTKPELPDRPPQPPPKPSKPSKPSKSSKTKTPKTPKTPK